MFIKRSDRSHDLTRIIIYDYLTTETVLIEPSVHLRSNRFDQTGIVGR